MVVTAIESPREDAQLLNELEASANLNAKAGKARSTTHKVWDHPTAEVVSWRFNEWDYSNPKLTLPVYARGLFTLDKTIVVRGYDKFFNIDEVGSTSWQWIEKNTQGPYYATLKSNGCIVFLAGLEDGTLVVTSKHSTGPRDADNDLNHSYVASKWVDKHLSKAGKSRKELALELYALNATAVGELCDDNFEEHILAYTDDTAGIYLHGLNVNSRHFATYDIDSVNDVCDRYGFLRTKFVEKNDIASLREFLDDCAQTGAWEGDDAEGFVVRCKATSSPLLANHRGKSPHTEASTPLGKPTDFFFKYKFEEPYLMYREWREATKSLILHNDISEVNISRRRGQTLDYLKFVKPFLVVDPVLRENYLRNKGIISLRQKYLDYKGKTGIEMATADDDEYPTPSIPDSAYKYALIPVATIGCGKTTLAVALKHLINCGHVQNDDFKTARQQKLVNTTVELFKTNRIVYVDRNNHMAREREQIITDLNQSTLDPLKFVCLNFLPYGPGTREWQITDDRVVKRAGNHQTITGLDDYKVRGIMRGFVNRFQRLQVDKHPDDMFNYVIDLDVNKGTRANLVTVLNDLRDKFDLVGSFSDAQIDEAMAVALQYKPVLKIGTRSNEPKGKKQAKEPKASEPKTNEPKNEPETNESKTDKPKEDTQISKQSSPAPSEKREVVFFNLSVSLKTQEMIDLIDKLFAANPDIDSSFWTELKLDYRVQKEFHVTLAHVLQQDEKTQGVFTVLQARVPAETPSEYGNHVIGGHDTNIRVTHVGFDGDALALKVDIEAETMPCAIEVPHITVGTRRGIPPKHSLDMLEHGSPTLVQWNIEPTTVSSQLAAFYA